MVRFTVDPRIIELFPELRLGVIIATGIDNSGSSEEVLSLLRSAESKVRNEFKPETMAQHPLISNWRQAYKLLKVKDGRPSHEALIRRVVRGDEIRHISKLVDIYNYLSLQYTTPFGGEDLDKVSGHISLRLAAGTEDFVELGSTETTHPVRDEVIYSDAGKVLCRKFNWRESDLTKLTEQTVNAFFVTETLPPFSEEQLDKALDEFSMLLSSYCNAKTTIFRLDKSNLEISW